MRSLPESAIGHWPLLAAATAVICAPTFYDLGRSYWNQDEYAHGPIILAIVLWLVWRERQKLLEPSPDVGSVTGFASLIVGLLIYIGGRSQQVPVVEVGALIPILASVVLIIWGRKGLAAFW